MITSITSGKIDLSVNTGTIDAVVFTDILFESEYQSILTFAQNQGFTLPSDSCKFLQNNYIKRLKEVGIWQLLDILYVFANDTPDLNFGRINWKNPGLFTLTQVGNPVNINKVGFHCNGDGAANRFLTGWTPSTHGINYKLNEASITQVLNSNQQLLGRGDFGVLAGSNSTGLNPAEPGGSLRNGINSGIVYNSGGIVDTSGFWHMYRTGSLGTDGKIFRNGNQLRATLAAANTASLPTTQFSVGSLGGETYLSNRQISMVCAGSSLVGLELVHSTEWNTYFNALQLI